jgi:hypothetical protein
MARSEIVSPDGKVIYTKEGMKIIEGDQEIPWEEIDKFRNQIRFANSILVTFSFSYGRANDYEEKYLFDKDEWAELKARMLHKEIYLGEIAGKHSDVTYHVLPGSITENMKLKDIIDFHSMHGMTNTNADPIGIFLDQEADGAYD